MAAEYIAAAVEAIDGDPAPAVVRFDDGPPLAGRVAALPSAFNPPTVAHVRLLEIATQVEGVTGLAALLTTRNVAKGVFGASLAQRVEMLLAIQRRRPEIAVLCTNQARILDQALALADALPAASFDFIVGYDTLVRFFDPAYYRDMAAETAAYFERSRLIATNRGEATIADVRAFVERPEVRPFRGRIVLREIEDEPASASSTAVRTTLENGGHPVAVPDEVRDYILRHRLYVEPAR
ncbi:MAG: hypothetical protein Kow0010_03250 [Dehalococcoidia bacterium]